MTAPDWAVHLPQGITIEDVDLHEGATLPGSWLQRWSGQPQHPTLYDDAGGWVTSERIEERSRSVA